MLDLVTAMLAFLVLLPLVGSIIFPYFWQDLVFLYSIIRIGYRSQKYLQRKPPFTMLDIFLAKVQKHPEKPFILFEEETYSYRDIDQRSSQVARVFRGHLGLKGGETVAVFLKNTPAYTWVWLGLEKIGCATACVNYNIRLKSLLHAFSSCKAKVVVTTPELKGAIEDVLPALQKEGVRVFYLSNESPTEGVAALLRQIESSSAEPVPLSFRANVTPSFASMYIFTSGTTGATLVLKSKFSVSQYWDDCRRYGVTVIQYVGEIMRYLCNAPKKNNDRDHNVRMAMGNGMRADVWKEFMCRFGPIRICEFYGATEGNIGFVNYPGKVGAVGRTSYLYKKLVRYELIRYDVDKEAPMRDEKGLCIPVALGEPGLLVCKVTAQYSFEGYAGDREKTEKKIIRDVLKKGDSYFNSGDLLMQDREGFIYFQDRVGDTFRWKGENVATTEVEATLAAVDFIQEVNVYGVLVPGHEGRIGMAAIQLKEGLSFDGKKLYIFAKDYLPNYAIPCFIRIQEVLEITGTFKQCKSQLVKEGFNPAIISNPLYFLDISEKCYVPMTQHIYSSILEKKLKL
ncbi:very long-chain acyl-CoA synthetase-like isoform X2 [Varanus komodoensis]|uniref:very long-chain acyl-CoA synthetase-like isoform X2 n=1 Tax=Varanus komodoensis TaxID=61221 RepID=UPI001CF78FD7|nr:very long-chain acyl-CoA synthetase-like isoform X2 [Varanus komodoensis]